MADDIDATDIRQQQMLDAQINNARQGSQVNIHGSGICLVCDNSVDPVEVCGKIIVGRFCSVECRDRYE
jgi:hypothetical protein